MAHMRVSSISASYVFMVFPEVSAPESARTQETVLRQVPGGVWRRRSVESCAESGTWTCIWRCGPSPPHPPAPERSCGRGSAPAAPAAAPPAGNERRGELPSRRRKRQVERQKVCANFKNVSSRSRDALSWEWKQLVPEREATLPCSRTLPPTGARQ